VKRKRKDFEAKEEGEKQHLGFVNFFLKKRKRKERNREHVKNTEHCYNDTE
jgi:hypothetical protein